MKIGATVENLVLAIIGVVLVLSLLAGTVGLVFTSLGNVSTAMTAAGQTTVGNLLTSNGVVALVIGFAILLLIIGLAWKGFTSKKR